MSRKEKAVRIEENEGVPRGYLQSLFPEYERDNTPMFRTIRNYDEEASYLCPPEIIPLRIQDIIAGASDEGITQSLVWFYRYCIGDAYPYSPALSELITSFRKSLRFFSEHKWEKLEEIFLKTKERIDHKMENGDEQCKNIARFAYQKGRNTASLLLTEGKTDMADLTRIYPRNLGTKNFEEDRLSIMTHAGYYSAWEALSFTDGSFLWEPNPFSSVLELIGIGCTRFSFRTINNREQILPHFFPKETDRNVQLGA